MAKKVKVPVDAKTISIAGSRYSLFSLKGKTTLKKVSDT